MVSSSGCEKMASKLECGTVPLFAVSARRVRTSHSADGVPSGAVQSLPILRKSTNTGPYRAEIDSMMSLSSPGGRPAILVANNNVFARNLLNRELSRDGYFVLAAANCEEAIALASNFTGEIQLFLSNSDLPGITTLVETIVRDRPGIRVVVIAAATHAELVGGSRVRRAPPGEGTAVPEALRSQIRRALADAEFSGAAEV
jgi:CheY-like chemotaxis protein